MKVQANFLSKFLCVVFTISGTVLFLVTFALLNIFLMDLEVFDQFNIPRISHNPFLNICNLDSLSKLPCTQSKVVLNLLLICLFWLQHIVLANKRIKEMLGGSYYIYERGLYTLSSDLLLLTVIYGWQPITEITLFSFRGSPFDFIFLILSIISVLIFCMTIPFFLQTDLFGIKRMLFILRNNYYETSEDGEIVVPMIYRTCRHPMQTGVIGSFLFTSSYYNIGRAFLVSAFLVGIILGVRQEESLLSKIDTYRKYKQVVKNKFFPNLFNLLNKDINQQLNKREKSN